MDIMFHLSIQYGISTKRSVDSCTSLALKSFFSQIYCLQQVKTVYTMITLFCFFQNNLELPTTTHCRVSALTSLFLRSNTAITVGCQRPGRGADAVVRPWSVHTMPILTIGWVLTLIHICTTKRATQCSR